MPSLSCAHFRDRHKPEQGKYVLGLSATVARQDGHHPIIFMQCGPVRYKVDSRLKQISTEEPRVIIATGKYLGEGYDDSRLDALFLCLPISWKGTVAQYAGRLHRLNDMKKEVVIYDYLDDKVPMLLKMFGKRQRGYRAIGYDVMGPDDAEVRAGKLDFEE